MSLAVTGTAFAEEPPDAASAPPSTDDKAAPPAPEAQPESASVPAPAPDSPPPAAGATAPEVAAPEAPSPPPPAAPKRDPVDDFRRDALRVERSGLAVKLGLPRGFQTQVVVTRADGTELDEAQLVTIAPNEELKTAVRTVQPPGWQGPVMVSLAIGLLALPPVLAVVGLLGGSVLGGLLGAVYGWQNPGSGQEGAARLMDLLPVTALGVMIGGLFGTGVGAVLIAPIAFLATSPVAPFADRQATENVYRQVVTAHNKELAVRLGLIPSTLGDEYFPAGL